MVIPPILGMAGRSGVGKTYLLERLIGRLAGRGLRVGAIKHCHHPLETGASGKDSQRLAAAGADPAVAAAEGAVQATGGSDTPPLLDLVATFCADRDLVLVEGYRRSAYDKVQVADEAEAPAAEAVRLRVGSGDVEAVESWVVSWLDRRRAMREGLTAAVLTGGGSRRMGTDKALLRIAGQRLLARVGGLLADRAGQVMFVGGEPDWTDMPACLGGAWHPDLSPKCGPMGGVATALRIAAAGRRPAGVCALACDMPALGGELLDHLLAGRDPAAAATALVNPVTGRVEPLAAVYEPQALPEIEKAISEGKLSLTDWLRSAEARRLPLPAELAGQCAGANTPEELAAIRRRMEQTSA